MIRYCVPGTRQGAGGVHRLGTGRNAPDRRRHGSNDRPAARRPGGRSRTGRHRAGPQRDARPHHHGHRHGRAVPGAGVVGWQLWNDLLQLERPRRVPDLYAAHRARRHGRLPSPLHAPRVQDEPVRARHVRDRSARRRSRARSSRGWPTTASTTRSPTSEGDPHSPHVDHGARLARRAARPLPRARRLAVHPHAARQPTSATRPTCSPTRWSAFVDRTFVLWALGGLVVPFVLG